MSFVKNPQIWFCAAEFSSRTQIKKRELSQGLVNTTKAAPTTCGLSAVELQALSISAEST